ncbi:MAG: hypothetical protein JF599_11835 [Verrucomicrobia bacterium]|nr:hypothetical protein [Verrucomicrobiota bacterium]
MEPSPLLPHRQILHEDLQIIRMTLATITDDIHRYCPEAAAAIQSALSQLDWAQEALGLPPAQA